MKTYVCRLYEEGSKSVPKKVTGTDLQECLNSLVRKVFAIEDLLLGEAFTGALAYLQEPMPVDANVWQTKLHIDPSNLYTIHYGVRHTNVLGTVIIDVMDG